MPIYKISKQPLLDYYELKSSEQISQQIPLIFSEFFEILKKYTLYSQSFHFKKYEPTSIEKYITHYFEKYSPGVPPFNMVTKGVKNFNDIIPLIEKDYHDTMKSKNSTYNYYQSNETLNICIEHVLSNFYLKDSPRDEEKNNNNQLFSVRDEFTMKKKFVYNSVFNILINPEIQQYIPFIDFGTMTEEPINMLTDLDSYSQIIALYYQPTIDEILIQTNSEPKLLEELLKTSVNLASNEEIAFFSSNNSKNELLDLQQIYSFMNSKLQEKTMQEMALKLAKEKEMMEEEEKKTIENTLPTPLVKANVINEIKSTIEEEVINTENLNDDELVERFFSYIFNDQSDSQSPIFTDSYKHLQFRLKQDKEFKLLDKVLNYCETLFQKHLQTESLDIPEYLKKFNIFYGTYQMPLSEEQYEHTLNTISPMHTLSCIFFRFDKYGNKNNYQNPIYLTNVPTKKLRTYNFLNLYSGYVPIFEKFIDKVLDKCEELNPDILSDLSTPYGKNILLTLYPFFKNKTKIHAKIVPLIDFKNLDNIHKHYHPYIHFPLSLISTNPVFNKSLTNHLIERREANLKDHSEYDKNSKNILLNFIETLYEINLSNQINIYVKNSNQILEDKFDLSILRLPFSVQYKNVLSNIKKNIPEFLSFFIDSLEKLEIEKKHSDNKISAENYSKTQDDEIERKILIDNISSVKSLIILYTSLATIQASEGIYSYKIKDIDYIKEFLPHLPTIFDIILTHTHVRFNTHAHALKVDSFNTDYKSDDFFLFLLNDYINYQEKNNQPYHDQAFEYFQMIKNPNLTNIINPLPTEAYFKLFSETTQNFFLEDKNIDFIINFYTYFIEYKGDNANKASQKMMEKIIEQGPKSLFVSLKDSQKRVSHEWLNEQLLYREDYFENTAEKKHDKCFQRYCKNFNFVLGNLPHNVYLNTQTLNNILAYSFKEQKRSYQQNFENELINTYLQVVPKILLSRQDIFYKILNFHQFCESDKYNENPSLYLRGKTVLEHFTKHSPISSILDFLIKGKNSQEQLSNFSEFMLRKQNLIINSNNSIEPSKSKSLKF